MSPETLLNPTMETREYDYEDNRIYVEFIKYTVLNAYIAKVQEKTITTALYLLVVGTFVWCLSYFSAPGDQPFDISYIPCDSKFIPSICGIQMMLKKDSDVASLLVATRFKNTISEQLSITYVSEIVDILYRALGLVVYWLSGFIVGAIMMYTDLSRARRQYIL